MAVGDSRTQAALFGQLRGVDVGDRLLGRPAKMPFSAESVRMPVSSAGERALVLDVERVRQPVAQAAKKRPSCSASPRKGRTVSETSRAATFTA